MAERAHTTKPPATGDQTDQPGANPSGQAPPAAPSPDVEAILARLTALEARNAELEAKATVVHPDTAARIEDLARRNAELEAQLAAQSEPSTADLAATAGLQAAEQPDQARDQLAAGILNWLQAHEGAARPVLELADKLKAAPDKILEAIEAAFFLKLAGDGVMGLVALNR